MTAKAAGFSIVHKLALLAGVPVAGALILAWIIVSGAQHEARSAAALGSVEDLAKLAAEISGTIHELQSERALLAWRFGQAPDADTKAQFARTDQALHSLEQFLAGRDRAKLPPRLARDLDSAQAALSKLAEQRATAAEEDADFLETLTYYADANGSLISAIAALMQLSNHGELLRTISMLASVLQIKESASQEHAVLDNVFEHREFAPGAYKELVKLVTEHSANERILFATADDGFRRRYEEALRGEFSDKTAKMRLSGLETMDDDFGVEAKDWHGLQSQVIDRLRGLENHLNTSVKDIALQRITAAQRALTTGTSLSAAVLLFSILLAWLIGRGVSRSVGSLSEAAAKVQRDKDFSVRASKVSNDELGMLTEAFNEMLSGIQTRDQELEHHRENLEHLVEERTAELSARNQAMRVVLDNVEEGLATIHMDGTLAAETSSAFARWFGAPASNTPLAKHLEQFSPKVAAMTEIGWESVAEDFLPWELSLEQMPDALAVNGRHYHMAYRGIANDQQLQGALLVVSDVTEELARARREAVQQEMLQVFSRITEDRAGFTEFLTEARRLVDATRERADKGTAEMMRTVHTIKGNCNIFGIVSVGAVAHELESFIVDTEQMPSDDEFRTLHDAWDEFEGRVASLVAESEGVIELTEAELDGLLAQIDRGAGKEELRRRVRALRFEPVRKRLARIGERARSLSKRLGKGDIQVLVEADEARPSGDAWSNLFASLVHAVRNAVDHGFESPDERKQAGKPPQATLALRFRDAGDTYVIELADDGRGIDWDRLCEKAKAAGLPIESEGDRIEVLFADGISSRDQVSDQSGRGVGMAALREAVVALRGRIEVNSQPGHGTTLRFIVPQKQVAERHVA